MFMFKFRWSMPFKIVKQSDHITGQVSVRCPFHGFRWKENSDRLFAQGNSECGLEFDTHEDCLPELLGEPVDYHHCPLASQYRSFLESSAAFIRFCPSQSPTGVDDIGIPFERKLEELAAIAIPIKTQAAG